MGEKEARGGGRGGKGGLLEKGKEENIRRKETHPCTRIKTKLHVQLRFQIKKKKELFYTISRRKKKGEKAVRRGKEGFAKTSGRPRKSVCFSSIGCALSPLPPEGKAL